MSFTSDLKKTATETGEGLVGLADLAVSRVRGARAQAVATGKALSQIDPKGVRDELVAQAGKAVQQAAEAPAVALKTATTLVAKVQGDVEKEVDALEKRGGTLVQRLRTQRATKDLVHQVDTTIALGRGAVTTARKAVDATTSSALATFTTARHEAEHTAETVKDTVVESVKADVETIAPEVEASAKRTRAAAKRTTTTARKGAARTTSRAKATTTAAKKTTARARKAAAAGAEKVGD